MSAGTQRRIDGGMIGNDRKTPITLFDATDEASESGFNQAFRLDTLAFFLLVEHGIDTVTVQYLLHGGGRHEKGLAVIGFQKTVTLVGGLDDTGHTRGFFTDLLLELGELAVVREHLVNRLGNRGPTIRPHTSR